MTQTKKTKGRKWLKWPHLSKMCILPLNYRFRLSQQGNIRNAIPFTSLSVYWMILVTAHEANGSAGVFLLFLCWKCNHKIICQNLLIKTLNNFLRPDPRWSILEILREPLPFKEKKFLLFSDSLIQFCAITANIFSAHDHLRCVVFFFLLVPEYILSVWLYPYDVCLTNN